ncbi:MAG: glutaredoxin family protein [Rectinemataceae bacterium]
MNQEQLPWVIKEGPRTDRDITVYALSTCGFCKRAFAFLDHKGFRYRYLYMDQIPVDTKNEIKAELKATFNEYVAFPFVVLDGKSHLVGFIEPDWVRTLGL